MVSRASGLPCGPSLHHSMLARFRPTGRPRELRSRNPSARRRKPPRSAGFPRKPTPTRRLDSPSPTRLPRHPSSRGPARQGEGTRNGACDGARVGWVGGVGRVGRGGGGVVVGAPAGPGPRPSVDSIASHPWPAAARSADPAQALNRGPASGSESRVSGFRAARSASRRGQRIRGVGSRARPGGTGGCAAEPTPAKGGSEGGGGGAGAARLEARASARGAATCYCPSAWYRPRQRSLPIIRLSLPRHLAKPAAWPMPRTSSKGQKRSERSAAPGVRWDM